MLCRNISKNSAFVTIAVIFVTLLTNCSVISSRVRQKSPSNDNSSAYDFSANYSAPQVVGTIKSDEINESSGLVTSRCNAGVFWTHNDSGDGAFIYAVDGKGRKLGTFRVTGAENVDWEDIAAAKTATGECFLYIGDTGNNAVRRREFSVYKVKEPVISGETDSNKKNPLETEAAEMIKITYPDKSPDAETLMINPKTGDIYILSKYLGGPASVYKLAANYSPANVNKLEKITDITVPAVPNGLLTGGDISPDGRHAVICDYLAAYEIELPKNDQNFDDIWKQKPAKINMGDRTQGEAVCYGLDGNTIYATSEKNDSPLIAVKRK